MSSWTATAAFRPACADIPAAERGQPDEGDAGEAALRRRAARDERGAADAVLERLRPVVVHEVLLGAQVLEVGEVREQRIGAAVSRVLRPLRGKRTKPMSSEPNFDAQPGNAKRS